MIRIDHDDWLLDARIHYELTHSSQLFCVQRQVRRAFRSDHSIDVKPTVHHPHRNQSVYPAIIEEIIDVRFADAGADTCHHVIVQAILEAFHCLAINAIATSSLVANDLGALDADQRCHVAQLAQSFGNFIGDKVSVGEDLKVSIGMSRENVEQFLVQERFTAENAKERVPHGFGFVESSVHRLKVDLRLLASDIDPTSLAAKIARIDDGDVKKGWKELPFFQTLLVLLDTS